MTTTISLALFALSAGTSAAEPAPPFRPPAIPLATVDPYMSVWSFTDRLCDSWPMHWTGTVHAMAGMVRIDGKALRFMGPSAVCSEPIAQSSVEVRPTQTIYTFEGEGVALTVTFMTPMLPTADLLPLAYPVTFVTFAARATDGKLHDVNVYFDATAEWVVNEARQSVIWDRPKAPEGLTLFQCGSQEQPILEKAGDNLRIDWGYLYVAVPTQTGDRTVIGGHETVRDAFRKSGGLPETDDVRQPRAANDDWPVLACALALGAVSDTAVERRIALAYDDVYSIEYMQKKLRPWWRKTQSDPIAMIASCLEQYEAWRKQCDALDADLVADAARIGGDEYARLIALSYRHVFASGKIVEGPDGEPWYFHKECFSNGCTATVDVSYPASPFYALFAPALLRGMMEPVFDFARSEAWRFPFAPHDVGTYPKANGQVYNAGKLEGQMPVEECGNMILMAALEAAASGNAVYAEKHWDLLTKWADYLKEKGLDPENQLCTDDFAGHLAHNTNLALKAINALGAYAAMAKQLGKSEAAEYRKAAETMAAEWVKMADNGDHYRLTFDKADTWSMKYNLVWDKLLGLGLFPPEVAQKEVAYYLKVQCKYGLPLDCRKAYTKGDWLVWSATLASSPEDFRALIARLYDFCNETPSRCPFTDWYDTKTAKCVGFRARPVIGGIFIKFLEDKDLWGKWRK